jgi:hypothetical protein
LLWLWCVALDSNGSTSCVALNEQLMHLISSGQADKAKLSGFCCGCGVLLCPAMTAKAARRSEIAHAS